MFFLVVCVCVCVTYSLHQSHQVFIKPELKEERGRGWWRGYNCDHVNHVQCKSYIHKTPQGQRRGKLYSGFSELQLTPFLPLLYVVVAVFINVAVLRQKCHD